MAAGRAGQELAEPDEISIGVFVEPAAAHDELLPEISDVRDRPAEAGEAQLQEGEENFDWRVSPTLLGRGWLRDDRHQALLIASFVNPKS